MFKGAKSFFTPPSPSHATASGLMAICLLGCLGGCQEAQEDQMSHLQPQIPPEVIANMPAKWATHSFPLSLRISEKFSPTEITSLQEQADAWESGIDHELDFFDYDFPAVENLDTPHAKAYQEHPSLGPHLGIYCATQWPEDFGPGTLAITQFTGEIAQDQWGFYLRITHGDIIFNYQDYDFSHNPLNAQFDFASVAIHELGHLLGLTHDTQSASNSVMQPSIRSRIQRQSLNAHDQTMIKNHYHLTPPPETESKPYHSAQTAHHTLALGQIVRGTIKVKANGQCSHSLEGKVVRSHR